MIALHSVASRTEVLECSQQPANDVHNQLVKLFVDAAASIAVRFDAEGLPTTS